MLSNMEELDENQLLMQVDEEQTKRDKKHKLKQFVRKCPQYIVGKKIQFPILDEYLKENVLIFPSESIYIQKPVGQSIDVFSNVPQSDLFEISTFVNNFPLSPTFSQMTDTQSVTVSTPLTMTSFMKVFVRLQCTKYFEVDDLHQILTRSDTGSSFKIDKQLLIKSNNLHLHLLAFFIEEVFRYRTGLFTKPDTTKVKSQKKQKVETSSTKNNKKSLKSIIDEIEQQEEQEKLKIQQEREKERARQEKMEEEESIQNTSGSEVENAQGLTMDIKEDMQGLLFWDFIYELYFTQINKGLKIRKKSKQDGEELDTELLEPGLNDEVYKKRQRFLQHLNAKKLKAKHKQKEKLMKFMKRNDYDNGFPLRKTETAMFKRIINCLSSSWVEILRQILKVPLFYSYFSKEAINLIENDLFNEQRGGYFCFTQRQKGLLLSLMISAIHNLDCFQTIAEYRQEICQELVKELEDAIKEMIDLKNTKQDTSTQIQEEKTQDNYQDLNDKKEQCRLKCKKLYLVNEFSQLWINGAQQIGLDASNQQFMLLTGNLSRLYVVNNNQWSYLQDKEIEELKKNLNLNGVKERELLRSLQKCEAFELLADEELVDHLKKGMDEIYINTHEEFTKSQPVLYDKANPFLTQVKQAMLEVENQITLFLMNGQCRWASYQARKEFQVTLENCTKLDQLKEFILMFVNSLDTIEQVKINHQKLQSSITQLKETDLKYLTAVSEKREVNDETIFQDLRLFTLMQKLDVIKHSKKLKFQLWGYSTEQIKKYWFQYLELVDNFSSLHFLVNVLLQIVEEQSYFTLEGEVYQDPELVELARQLDQEDKQQQKEIVKTVSQTQLIEIVDE